MGIFSDLLNGFSSLSQQSAATNAANQDTSALNSVLQNITGLANQAGQQYYGQGGGASILSSLLGNLSGQYGQPMNNPYSQGASGPASSLSMGGNNPNMQAAGGTASQLQNYSGLKPQEIAALQTQLGNNGQQTINTLRGQMGGTANPQALIQSLMGQNMQNSLNLGTQLGGQAAGQELSALQSAGGLQSGLSSQNIGAMSSGGGLFADLSGQNNQYQNMLLQGLISGTGQQAGILGDAYSGLAGVGNAYNSAAQNASNQAYQAGQNAMNSFGGALNSIPSLFMGGMGAGASGLSYQAPSTLPGIYGPGMPGVY